jgi:hypothetical protein
MGSFLSILLLAGLGMALREKPLGAFVSLGLFMLLMLTWFFYTDITQPLTLSF